MSHSIPRTIYAALAAKKMSLMAACRESGLHRNVFARQAAKDVQSGKAPTELLSFATIRNFFDDLPAAPEKPGDAERLKKKLSEAHRRIRDAEAQLEADRSLNELLGGLVATPADPPKWLNDYVPHLDSRESVPVLMLTDWHYGEVVNPATSGGYAFNAEIAEARIKETVEKTIRMAREHLSGLTYPGIVVALGGDMTSGALHPELAESDEYEVMEQISRAVDLIIAAITSLADEFGRVYVPTAVGNHGRIFDRKPRAKGYAKRNADFWIYTFVAKHFRDDPRVVIEIPDAGETVFRVYGRTFLLTHGDSLGAKGGDGLIGAIGPVMRGSLKTMKSLGSFGINPDHVLMGHWHQPLFLPNVTVSGSLKGPDEYALRMLRAPAEDPSQTLFFVHPAHGVTFRQPIFLRDEHCPDRSKDRAESRWLEVFGA